MEYRSDRDSLGTVKIPADAYYGSFTGRAIKQYHVTEQKPHPYMIIICNDKGLCCDCKHEDQGTR